MNEAQSTLSFSLIVLNWNGQPYLDKCLDSLVAQDYLHVEIIVVDNNSMDDSPRIVKSCYPTIRLIENQENLGFAGGMNVGLRIAQGDVLALLNNDVILRPDWTAAIAAAMSADPRLGIAGGKLLYPDEKTLQHAGGYFHNPPIAMPDHYGYRQLDTGQYQARREVDFVTGAAMAFRRMVVDEIGGLDDNFTFYYEETDFEFRARRAGWKVVYIPEAVGIHLESISTVRDSFNFFRHFHRSRLRFILKNYGRQKFLRESYPAEVDWLKRIELPQELSALRQAYLDALLSLTDIPDLTSGSNWDWQEYRGVMTAIQQLRQIVLDK